MKRLHTSKTTSILFSLLILWSTSFLIGCDRKPEDLEKWRSAQGGMEKLQEWAKSSKESMPVRQRAVQILIEEKEAPKIQQMFDSMKDEAARAQLASAATTTIESMWAAKDYPKMNADLKKGERVKVGPSKSVDAKDAAYLIYPYANDQDKAKLQAILGEWLSADHDLRDQLGRAKLAQILPRAGDKGFDGIMVWFGTMEKPGMLARRIRQNADDKTKERFAKAVRARAEKDHPNLSGEMRVIVLETEHPEILPYLQMAIKDPKSSGKLKDDSMDAYMRIQGAKATPFLNELVASEAGLMRSVAFTRLIELRGKAGVTQGINAMPLEMEKYPKEGEYVLEKEVEYYCNIIKTELEKKKVKEIKPVIAGLLKSPRWPAKLIGAHCAQKFAMKDLKPQIEAFKEDATLVPGWGGEKTLGAIATEASAKL